MRFLRCLLITLVFSAGMASAQDAPTPEETPPVTEEATEEVTELPATPGPDGRITICHVAGRADDPANFRTLNLSPNAVFGPGGHFNENGTARAGHEQDTFGPCPGETPEVTESAECVQIEVDEAGFPLMDDPIACGPDTTPVEPVPFTIPIGEPTCMDWVAYHSNQTGDWELFRAGELPDQPDADPNLSQGAEAHDIAPSRSPDQRWIAFASSRDGNWEVYVAAADGSLVQRVTFNTFASDLDPMWSPAGRQIAYESTRDGNWELYVVDVNTGAETRLTDNPASDRNAFWSPDGARLLFQSDRDGLWQIYELDLLTLEVRKFSDGAGPDDNPQYSFHGDQIAFRSFRDGSSGVIHLMNTDGSNLRAISDPAGAASNHAWASDDVALAYQSNLDGDLDIYIYDLASGQTRLLTDNSVPDYAPTWICNTPDVVFTSDVTGDPNLYLTAALPVDALPIPVPEGAEQLTDNPAADQYPQNTPADEDASRRVTTSPGPGS